MTLLEMIKPRIGIYYSEENKDNEIRSMISGAIQYFKGAGWNFIPLLSSLDEKSAELKELEEKWELLQEIEDPTLEETEEMEATEKAITDTKQEKASIIDSLSLPAEAITLYCKMAQPTSPFQLTNHPVLTSMIAQGRSGTDGDI